MTDLIQLCEDIANGDTNADAHGVNMYQIEPEDFEALRRVQANEPVEDADLAWLQECDLVSIDGGTVNLTQFSISWLKTLSQSPTV